MSRRLPAKFLPETSFHSLTALRKKPNCQSSRDTRLHLKTWLTGSKTIVTRLKRKNRYFSLPTCPSTSLSFPLLDSMTLRRAITRRSTSESTTLTTIFSHAAKLSTDKDNAASVHWQRKLWLQLTLRSSITILLAMTTHGPRSSCQCLTRTVALELN